MKPAITSGQFTKSMEPIEPSIAPCNSYHCKCHFASLNYHLYGQEDYFVAKSKSAPHNDISIGTKNSQQLILLGIFKFQQLSDVRHDAGVSSLHIHIHHRNQFITSRNTCNNIKFTLRHSENF